MASQHLFLKNSILPLLSLIPSYNTSWLADDAACFGQWLWARTSEGVKLHSGICIQFFDVVAWMQLWSHPVFTSIIFQLEFANATITNVTSFDIVYLSILPPTHLFLRQSLTPESPQYFPPPLPTQTPFPTVRCTNRQPRGRLS